MAERDPQFAAKERWMLVIRIAVTGVILGASLFVILRNSYPDATTKWAFGIAGLVIGYWLR